jgi:hypothetical protein
MTLPPSPSTLCEYYYYRYTFRLFFFNDDP